MASTENSWRGQDQLLNIVVQAERPELAEEKVGCRAIQPFWGRFFWGKPDLPSGYLTVRGYPAIAGTIFWGKPDLPSGYDLAVRHGIDDPNRNRWFSY